MLLLVLLDEAAWLHLPIVLHVVLVGVWVVYENDGLGEVSLLVVHPILDSLKLVSCPSSLCVRHVLSKLLVLLLELLGQRLLVS